MVASSIIRSGGDEMVLTGRNEDISDSDADLEFHARGGYVDKEAYVLNRWRGRSSDARHTTTDLFLRERGWGKV